MTEATYNHFAAHLREATGEVEARLRRWASDCEEYNWVRDDSNRATLYFARAESRTTRQMQSLLRALTSQWRTPLGKLEAGWLQPLSVDEYRAAVSTAGAAECARPHADEPPQIAVPTMAPPPAGPCTGAAAGHVVLERLSAGFDTRAREAYRTLLRRAPTAMAQAAHKHSAMSGAFLT